MRWFWIDRFTEFESGRRAVAVKNVSLAEDHLHQHFRLFPVMPPPLVIEGLAQTGGLLVNEAHGFTKRVVLAKISKAKFHTVAEPGDTLTYTSTVEDLRPDGAFTSGTSYIGDRLHAEIDLVFAYINSPDIQQEMFDPLDFLQMLRTFRLFDVGHKSDGSPLEIPPHLLEVERARFNPTGE